VVFQRAGTLGDEPMKAPNLCDLLNLHYLILVRQYLGHKTPAPVSHLTAPAPPTLRISGRLFRSRLTVNTHHCR
jgi:hypothetical protein